MYEINRRWFKNISFLAHLMLSIIFVNSTGIILATRAMDLYHVPIMAAMMFLILTMYFWIKALPEKEKGTLKGKYLTIGSVTMALVCLLYTSPSFSGRLQTTVIAYGIYFSSTFLGLRI